MKIVIMCKLSLKIIIIIILLLLFYYYYYYIYFISYLSSLFYVSLFYISPLHRKNGFAGRSKILAGYKSEK